MAEIHGTSSEKFIALRETLAKNLDRGKGEMFGFPRLKELVAEHGEERVLGNSY